VAGFVLLAGALVWYIAAVPALVKYPTDLKASPSYTGTMRVFADPAAFAPLPTPIEAPLKIDRTLDAVGSESGASHVVVDETIVQRAGELLDATQHNAYVLDRRSMTNVADPRAYAFTPTNQVDRAGSYRIQLPMNLDPRGTYTMYDNDWAATYTMTGSGRYEDTLGLRLYRFTTDAAARPISDAYLAELRKGVPLPDSLTVDQLKPQLATMGIDIDALVAALLPVLSEADRASLLAVAAAPVPLQYVLGFSGSMGVERKTGSEVKLYAATEKLGVRPAGTGLATLDALLGRYSDVPEAATARAALQKVAAGDPIPVVQFDYAQTPASVAAIATDVKSSIHQAELAERWIPGGMAVAGAVLLAIWMGLRFKGERKPAPRQTPVESDIEHERITPTSV
jgi:hypothetical protein